MNYGRIALRKAPSRFIVLSVSIFLLICARSASAQTNVYVSNSSVNTPTVKMIDGVNNTVAATIPIPALHAGGLAFTPDGQRLYVGTQDGPGSNDVVVIDTVPASLTFNQVIATITVNFTVGSVTFNSADQILIDPQGRFLYGRFLAFVGNSVVAIGIGAIDIRPSSPAFHQVIGVVSGLSLSNLAAAFTPNGRELWWCQEGPFGNPSSIAVINTDETSPGFNTATQVPLPAFFAPTGISITPDGTKAFVSGWVANKIKVIDALSKTPVTDLVVGGGFRPRGNAVAPDGTRFYAVTDGGTFLNVYDAVANSFINGLPLDFTGGIHNVTVSVDGTRAYVSGTSINVIHVVNVSNSPPTLVTDVVVGPSFIMAVQPVTPFAAFAPKVEIELGPLANDDAFEVKAAFIPGSVIAPLTEDVSLQVGTFSTTIPAGSFKQDKKGRFKFEGIIGGVALEAVIRPLGGGMFEFKAEGEGANLTGTVNPVRVILTIGNDGGSTTVTAEFVSSGQ